MKTLIILGVFGLCLGSPFNPVEYPAEYPDYGDGSLQYNQQPLADERNSQAYQPPQLQVLDDTRYHSRFEGDAADEDYYYDEEENNLNSIPGEPGKDYPVLGAIPRTAFSCADKLPGFYADIDAACQVWHYCKTDGIFESFLCPNGTIYNQENRVCEWWFNVDCQENHKFEHVNEDLYIIPESVQQYQDVEQRVYRQRQEQRPEEYRSPVYQQDVYQKQ